MLFSYLVGGPGEKGNGKAEEGETGEEVNLLHLQRSLGRVCILWPGVLDIVLVC